MGPRARVAILKKIKISPAGIHKNSRCRIQMKNVKIISKLGLKSWSPGRGVNPGFFQIQTIKRIVVLIDGPA